MIDAAVATRINDLTAQRCEQWGGEVTNNGNQPRKLFTDTPFADKTVVSDSASAYDAFQKYTPYFEHVLDRTRGNTGSAVFVPCSSTKPIGTSQSHKRRLNVLEKAGVTPESDLFIVSEPCVIIPDDERLTLPAVNYEFPPEYTAESAHPNVFNIFVDRLATWLDTVEYRTIYSYVVKGHSNKIHEAVQRAASPPTLVSIPYASISLRDRDNYAGDMLKSTEAILAKFDYAFVKVGENQQEDFIQAYDLDLWEQYESYDPVTVFHTNGQSGLPITQNG